MAKKDYTKEDLTVHWDSSLCIHSKKCFHGLSSVFDPNERPWINVEGATKETIMKQIDHCPSGALSYTYDKQNEGENMSEPTKVEPLKNGPLMVYGDLTLKTEAGEEKIDRKAVAFCRCGHSDNKPYCDGQHKAHDFKA
ncbi:MAG: (4Fe-4S)-binding protein [Candidatus Kapaibacterium sp.]